MYAAMKNWKHCRYITFTPLIHFVVVLANGVHVNKSYEPPFLHRLKKSVHDSNSYMLTENTTKVTTCFAVCISVTKDLRGPCEIACAELELHKTYPCAQSTASGLYLHCISLCLEHSSMTAVCWFFSGIFVVFIVVVGISQAGPPLCIRGRVRRM